MSILKWYMCNIITPQAQALSHTHTHINAHNIFTLIFLGLKQANNVCLCRRSIDWPFQHPSSCDRCCQGPLKLLQA